MSTEDEWRELQSRGARNQFHFSNNEGYVGIQQYQHSFVNSSPTTSMNNIPVGHSGDVLYHQPWQRNEYGNNEFTSLNFWQANQNFLDRDPSGASSSTAQQLIPSINSYPVTTSTKPTVSPCVASISRQQQQYQQMVELEPTTPALQAESAAVNMAAGDNHECPICGREFVYQLNFVKHLAAAACCQPPCKKSRKQEEENKEAFKSSTLPRSSRSKKVTRSNSTKSRKTRHTIPSLNAVVPELIPSAGKEITCEYQENSLMTTGTKDLNIQPTTSTTRLLMATKTTTLEEIGEYCDFCQLQLGAAGNQQRHRLAHALVIQLTRCLEMSVMNSSRETDSGNNPAVFNWLTDQVRVNFSDHSWLRQAVKEVEQVLDCSNMDVDIRQHHGIQQDDNQFQNSLVELLVTEDPPHQKNTCRILDPVPEGLHPLELSETCWTSITSNPPSVQPDPLCSSSPLTSVSSELASSSSSECSPQQQATSSLDLSQSDDAFNNSLGVDIHQVEKQMADLFRSRDEFACPECGECFPQSELMFQHMSFDHPLQDDAARLLRHERSVDSGVFPDLGTDDLLGYSFDQSLQ